MSMKRFGQVIGLKPEQIATYEDIHARVWPEVLEMIGTCNMRNYSIFRHDTLLFAYFEYVGDDVAGDMARMAADPKTREWSSVTEPMQEPVASRSDGEWWKTLPEVFHCD
jgi:L-rhamnose mutarotase